MVRVSLWSSESCGFNSFCYGSNVLSLQKAWPVFVVVVFLAPSSVSSTRKEVLKPVLKACVFHFENRKPLVSFSSLLLLMQTTLIPSLWLQNHLSWPNPPSLFKIKFILFSTIFHKVTLAQRYTLIFPYKCFFFPNHGLFIKY